jgi:hypothetical protein
VAVWAGILRARVPRVTLAASHTPESVKVIVVGLARLHPIILAEFNASDYFSLYIIILRVRLEVM